MKVLFKKSASKKLFFDDLNVGDEFVIDTTQSRGTEYTKVKLSSRLYSDYEYGMIENGTCKVFSPTNSPVRRV